MEQKISKKRFENYEKDRQSGRMNMISHWDSLVRKNYEKCFEHFVENKKEEDLIISS